MLRTFTALSLLVSASAFQIAARPVLAPSCNNRIAVSTSYTPSATRAVARASTPMASSVVIKEDYKVAGGFVGFGLLVVLAPWLIGGFSLVLGSFLLFQTFRIRFVFNEDSFEVKTKPLDNLFSAGDEIVETGENFAVGGANVWKYDSFVNWEFFPSEDIPILVYFKETQTPEKEWNVGPGEMANSAEALAKGAVRGQVHFFPCIASASQIKENFMAKGCAKL
jgi:hypothetical protein